MPTGTGKTEVFCSIIREFRKRYESKRIIVLVHRNYLVDQIQTRLIKKFKMPVGVVKADEPFSIEWQVHICSKDTLLNRNYDLGYPSLIVIDEAHHSAADTYQKLIKRFKNDETKFLGVTATPMRMDGKLLSGIFQKLIVSDPISSFIRSGYLSKLKYYAIDRLDRSKMKVDSKSHDYLEEDAYQFMHNDRIMAEITTAYTRYANEKKAIVFCVNLKHAGEVKERFLALDILADTITTESTKKDREDVLKRFTYGEIRVLINVQIFTEGFDCPNIDCVILARPTKSLTLFLQMVGRVTRKASGKNYGLVLDNADNWKEHGLPTDEINWEEIFNLKPSEPDEWLQAPIRRRKLKKNHKPKESINFEMTELIGDNELYYQPENPPPDPPIPDPNLIDVSLFHRVYSGNPGKIIVDLSYCSLSDYVRQRKMVLTLSNFVASEMVANDIAISEYEMSLLYKGTRLEPSNMPAQYRILKFQPEDYHSVQSKLFLYLWQCLKTIDSSEKQ